MQTGIDSVCITQYEHYSDGSEKFSHTQLSKCLSEPPKLFSPRLELTELVELAAMVELAEPNGELRSK